MMSPEPVLNKALFLNNPEQSFKEYERLRLWYINALARVQRAEKERERWHGKYMMVKHENNKLRQRLRPLRISGICPQCKTEQAVNKNRRNRYYCAECGVKYELYVDKQFPGGSVIYRARLLDDDAAPHK